MGIGAADAKGGDTCPTRMLSVFPRDGLGEQADRALCPVDMGSGLVNMQGFGEDAVAHGHDHLDDPGHASSSLGMTDVGLERA